MMPNTNLDIYSSRLFIKSDPMIKEFRFENLYLNIFEPRRKWWSRPYEYKWMGDTSSAYFDFLEPKSAIDVATGNSHPGIFILKKSGFSKVVGTDLFDITSYQHRVHLKDGMQFVKDDILCPKINEKFDCLTCVSVLEHFHPDTQKKALQNMITYLNPNSCIILTFDMPGFDYLTNLPLYKETLSENSFSFREDNLKEGDVVVNSSNCSNAGRLARRRLSCYRIFAWRKV